MKITLLYSWHESREKVHQPGSVVDVKEDVAKAKIANGTAEAYPPPKSQAELEADAEAEAEESGGGRRRRRAAVDE